MQVHITQGDHIGRSVIVSWVTPLESQSNYVTFWEEGANTKHHHHKHKAHAKTTSYKYYNYTSGYIHHATIKRLKVCIDYSFLCFF